MLAAVRSRNNPVQLASTSWLMRLGHSADLPPARMLSRPTLCGRGLRLPSVFVCLFRKAAGYASFYYLSLGPANIEYFHLWTTWAPGGTGSSRCHGHYAQSTRWLARCLCYPRFQIFRSSTCYTSETHTRTAPRDWPNVASRPGHDLEGTSYARYQRSILHRFKTSPPFNAAL